MGAAAAGCKTAFIQRPGKALFPGTLKPTYVCADLADLAIRLRSATDQGRSLLVPALAGVSAFSVLALAAGVMRSRSGQQ